MHTAQIDSSLVPFGPSPYERSRLESSLDADFGFRRSTALDSFGPARSRGM
jgi:hypothetical protein